MQIDGAYLAQTDSTARAANIVERKLTVSDVVIALGVVIGNLAIDGSENV